MPVLQAKLQLVSPMRAIALCRGRCRSQIIPPFNHRPDPLSMGDFPTFSRKRTPYRRIDRRSGQVNRCLLFPTRSPDRSSDLSDTGPDGRSLGIPQKICATRGLSWTSTLNNTALPPKRIREIILPKEDIGGYIPTPPGLGP